MENEEIIEHYPIREAISMILKNGVFSWEDDKTISLDGTNILLKVIKN